MGEKRGKKDVGTTLSKRERDRRKIAQAVGRRGRSPTRDLDLETQTEPRTFGQPKTHITRNPNTRPSTASQPINPRPAPASRPITARPVTCVRSETRERPVNPRLDPRCLHTRRSWIVPRVTPAVQLLSAQAASSAQRLRRLIRHWKPVSSPFDTVLTLLDLVSALFKVTENILRSYFTNSSWEFILICEILTEVTHEPIGTNHQRKRRTSTRS